MTNKAYTKAKNSKTTKIDAIAKSSKSINSKRFPDLTEFRRSIVYKGESLTEILIKGRS